ncbi:MAG: phytanoyl-CoA dioxygenase family protein [Bacteroidetes bacterium]|nr:phytanoyl-CoA dioxygenase family protein [Bacteroidota bacterium]
MKVAQLNDPALERELQDTGYIRIPHFLSAAEVTALLDIYRRNHPAPEPDAGMWNSLYNQSEDGAMSMSEQILHILRPRLDALFVSYYAPVGTFMSKNNNKYSECDLHRDFSIADEEQYQYRNLWMPLVDTTLQNGALFALPGSHRVFDYMLPMFCEWPYRGMLTELIPLAQTIECQAGDLVIYLDKTLHGSHVNHSGHSRPVVHFGALHPDVEMRFHWLDRAAQRVRAYLVPFSFYLANDFSEPVGRYPMVKEYDYTPPQLSIERVKELLAGSTAQ